MSNVRASVEPFAIALRKLVEAAAKDGGKSFDDLAARIKAREADALIEEAIGYVPEELKALPKGDPFRPIKHNGRGGKRNSRAKDLACPLVDKIEWPEITEG